MFKLKTFNILYIWYDLEKADKWKRYQEKWSSWTLLGGEKEQGTWKSCEKTWQIKAFQEFVEHPSRWIEETGELRSIESWIKITKCPSISLAENGRF